MLSRPPPSFTSANRGRNDEIRDDEYDYLFVVRVAPGMQPIVETRGYGAERRETAAARLQREQAKAQKMQAKAQAKAVK